MSYQVLARKWRPQNFKQMVGQEHVLQALIHALESQRLHHAYLFTGTRGVGKTTIGRILAKCLSCHTGITAEPCGECGACLGISEGRYVDLIEIDAASRTKVEDMRELLDNVQYAPSEGRFKIYLIDEVHMLSQSSFNALLKTLEEPPEHVKFLFATTDPQKLPVTILSRCLQFNLKNMSPERIVGHLKHILAEESVRFEDAALWALARAADGSMRDALSLTDQAIAYGHSSLVETEVSAMLGTVDQKRIYRILDSLIGQQAAGMLAEVADLAEFSPDYGSVLASLLSVLHRVAIEQAVPGATDNSMGDQEQVQNYAQQLCAEDVQLFYQIALVSRKDLALSPDPKSALEMALLRMLAFQLTPAAQAESLNPSASAPSYIPESGTPELAPEPMQVPEDSSVPQTMSVDQRPEPPPIEEVPALAEPENVDVVSNYAANPEPQTLSAEPLDLDDNEQSKKKTELETEIVGSENLALDAADNEIQHAEPVQNNDDLAVAPPSSPEIAVQAGTDIWPKEATQLGLSGMTQNLLLNMFREQNGTQIKMFVESGHYRLLNRSHEERIIESLLKYYANSESVLFIDGLQSGQETPMMWRARRSEEMLADAQQAVNQDENVLRLIKEFDASLVPGSVEALGDMHEM